MTLNQTRAGKTMRRIALVAMIAGRAISASAEEPEKPFALQQHRAEIREALLKDTPLGASEKDVMAAISKRLVVEPDKLPPIEDILRWGRARKSHASAGCEACGYFSVSIMTIPSWSSYPRRW
ncbi:MAG: hypothetical protein ABR526_05565 [Chthoniobacterales bacterium]